jgi:hypothetical protein
MMRLGDECFIKISCVAFIAPHCERISFLITPKRAADHIGDLSKIFSRIPGVTLCERRTAWPDMMA